MRRALVTGATGQDGSYLCEHLVRNGYEAYGLVRRSTRNFTPIPAVHYLTGDLLDGSSIMAALEEADPAGGVQPRGGHVRRNVVAAARGAGGSHRARGVAATECGPWFSSDIKVYQASTQRAVQREGCAPQ